MHTYIYIYICLCVYIYTYLCVPVCLYVSMYACVSLCDIFVCTQSGIWAVGLGSHRTKKRVDAWCSCLPQMPAALQHEQTVSNPEAAV